MEFRRSENKYSMNFIGICLFQKYYAYLFRFIDTMWLFPIFQLYINILSYAIILICILILKNVHNAKSVFMYLL